MKRNLIALAVLVAIFILPSYLLAAGTTVANLPDRSASISGTDYTICDDGSTTGKCTVNSATGTMKDVSGNIIIALSGTSLTAGSLYAVDPSGNFRLADASANILPAVCVARSTTACTFSGVYKYAASQSWTRGDILYASDATPGAIKNTVPTTVGHFIQRIGVALANDTILVMPSLDVGGL